MLTLDKSCNKKAKPEKKTCSGERMGQASQPAGWAAGYCAQQVTSVFQLVPAIEVPLGLLQRPVSASTI